MGSVAESFSRPIALISARAQPTLGFGAPSAIEKVRRLTEEAAGQGAELVVFPEAFVSAYPKGLDFGARVGSRSSEGREDFRRYFDSAAEVPGAIEQTLLQGFTRRS